MLGASQQQVLAAARKLNQHDVETTLLLLPIELPLFRSLMIWAIHTGSASFILTLIAFARHIIQQQANYADVEERKESVDIMTHYSFAITTNTFDRELQSYLELACYLGQIACARALINSGIQIRNETNIRTAGYFIFKIPEFQQYFLEFAPTVSHQSLAMAQLKKDNLYGLFGKLYSQSTMEVCEKFRAHEVVFNMSNSNSFEFDSNDIVSFYQHLTALPENEFRDIIRTFKINFTSEAFYLYCLIKRDLYSLPEFLINDILDGYEIILAHTPPDYTNLTSLQSKFEKSLIYHQQSLHLINRITEKFDKLSCSQTQLAEATHVIGKIFPGEMINYVTNEVSKPLDAENALLLTMILFHNTTLPHQNDSLLFSNFYCEIFHGYFSHILLNMGSVKNFSHLSFYEKLYLKKTKLNYEQKNNILLAVLKESGASIDLSLPSHKSIFNSLLKTLGLEVLDSSLDKFNQYQITVFLPVIIEYLTKAELNSFALSCWQYACLVQDPKAKFTKNELTKFKREVTQPKNAKRWQELAIKLEQEIELAIDNKSFFSHRLTHKRYIKLAFIALFIADLAWYAWYLNKASTNKAKFNNTVEEGTNILICNDIRNATDCSHNCANYLTLVDEDGSYIDTLKNCLSKENLAEYQSLPWPIVAACQSFCDTLDEISKFDNIGYFALAFISPFLLLTVAALIIAFCKRQGRERFETITLSELSKTVKLVANQLAELEHEIPGSTVLEAPTEKKVSEIRTHLINNRNLFLQRRLIAEPIAEQKAEEADDEVLALDVDDNDLEAPLLGMH